MAEQKMKIYKRFLNFYFKRGAKFNDDTLKAVWQMFFAKVPLLMLETWNTYGDALCPFKLILNIISSYFYLKVKINAPPPISLLFTKGAVHFSKLGRYIDLGPLKKLFEWASIWDKAKVSSNFHLGVMIKRSWTRK